MNRSMEYYQELVRLLAALPTEVEWVEFKVNNKEPEKIAKYIAALSNAAALCGRVSLQNMRVLAIFELEAICSPCLSIQRKRRNCGVNLIRCHMRSE